MSEEAITIADQIACVKREIAMRKSVYQRWIALGKMKQAQAEHEILCMQAVLETLLNVQATKNPG